MRHLSVIFAALMLWACSGASDPLYFESENPETLSAWGQVNLEGRWLRVGAGVTPYDLNTPLFSDYAGKLRTVWIAGGEAASYSGDEAFDFPVGTVISKTFYYAKGATHGEVKKTAALADLSEGIDLAGHKLIETRILVRRPNGWDALPYVWNEDQTEAYLKRVGDVKKLTLVSEDGLREFAYIVPNTNQCAGCHATDSTSRDVHPIGPKARHLNRNVTYASVSQDQLAFWQDRGLLDSVPPDPPANADWADPTLPVRDRARAYIDINCSHCHSEKGPADTSGLHLTPDTPMGPHLGLCKTPIAAGRGTGGREYGIVPGDAERSIFAYRMASTDPGIMMPEVGRSLAHDEGVALIASWINQLNGQCGT